MSAKEIYERLLEKFDDIVEIMKSDNIKDTVRKIQQMPEFSDLKYDSVRREIKAYPAIAGMINARCADARENESLRLAYDAVLSENTSLKNELARLKHENEELKRSMTDVQPENKGHEQMNIMDIQDTQTYEDRFRQLEKGFSELRAMLSGGNATDIQRSIKPKKETVRLGKWAIVEQNGYYKAVRNFGKLPNGKKDIQNIYIGKVYTEEIARAKIEAKGYDIGIVSDIDRESLISAYQRIAERVGFSNIMISDLQAETGIELEQLQAFLLAESRVGRAVLTPSDFSIATDEQRQAAMLLNGRHYFQVRFDA